LDNLNVIGLSVWTSRGAGLCLAYDGALILLPVCRNIIRYLRALSFLNRLIPFDENLWFHRQTAYSMLFWTLVHTFAHYVNFWKLEQLGLFQAWQLHYTTWAGLTAQGVCKGYFSWRYTTTGGIIYFLERILREIRARQPTQITKVIAHPSKAIEIQFDKPSFRYKAGQYLFLNVPAISIWQWHPFTITSAPDDPFVSVHVRLVGDFTNKLGEFLGCDSNSDYKKFAPTILPTLRIDGPYGAPAEDVFKNEIAVLIGCGIGVTPFASILKNIWYVKITYLKAIESGRYIPGKEGDLNTNVGVYYCGPPALAKSLKKDCESANTEGINFHFHKEHF
ncbi:17837_t:CDS:2, partial [Racocetra fulgida]